MNWNNDNDGPWGRPGGSGNGRKPTGGNAPEGGSDFDDLLARLRERFDRLMQSDGGPKKLVFLTALGLALLWLASGIYQVQPGEQGVVLRFGDYNRTTAAGLRYRMPWPLEAHTVVNTQLVRKESFGTSSSDGESDSLMLMGDENIIDITFDVQWNIRDPRAFLFNVVEPVPTVRSVAASAMREIIGKTTFTYAQTAGKSQIEQDTRKLIQETLDSYKAGVRILSVNLLEASAPGPVVSAVRDVQAARADEERARNEAESYRNDIIPKARGQAERMLQDAEAYRQEVIARAQGDVARFNAVYEQYAKAQDVTKKRMYLETMEKILSGMNKIILENKSGALPYLPLPALKPPAVQEEEQ